jgi:hypothetical protein
MIIVDVAGFKSVLRDGRVDMQMLWESMGKPANKSPRQFMNGTHRYRYRGQFINSGGYICEAEVALRYVYWATDGECAGEPLHAATELGDRLTRIANEIKQVAYERGAGYPGGTESMQFLTELVGEIEKTIKRGKV